MNMPLDCPICTLYRDINNRNQHEIYRDDLWVLRHHPAQEPPMRWLLLDSLLYCNSLIDLFSEAKNWSLAVQDASILVKKITQCDRVYTIAFGEGAQHLHLHLIPRFISNPNTKAWSVADHYRSVDSGESSPVFEEQLQNFVVNARQIMGKLLNYS